jgi:hypothetical protein
MTALLLQWLTIAMFNALRLIAMRPRMGLMVVAIALLLQIGCRSEPLNPSVNWNVYRNPRFQFEFPYPANWQSSPSPANKDGQIFVDPDHPEVEIRGWGSQPSALLKATEASLATLPQPNFQTNQGLPGILQVEIGSETSTMTLKIEQGSLVYYWEGRSPNSLFAENYQRFDYIARQYRVPGSKESD